MLNKEVISRSPGLVLDKERVSNVGVGFVILRIDPSKNGENSRDPYVWTVEELCDKPATSRRKGDISIPFETREGDELHVQTLRRGLFEEFAGLKDLASFSPNIFFGSRQRNVNLDVGERRIACDVDIVIYDGLRTDTPIPSSFHEVKPHGWMPLFGKKSVFELPNLRPIARQALDEVVKNNSIVQALANYEKSRHLTGGRPIFSRIGLT